MTKQELERKIAVLLGGSVAGQVIFDHFSTGASDDLARITDIALNMVTRYGMAEVIGHIVMKTTGKTTLAKGFRVRADGLQPWSKRAGSPYESLFV